MLDRVLRLPFLAVPFTLGAFPALAAGPAVPALERIQPAALRAHVGFLADDLLEGRGTATRGHEIAASYVASRFEALGLEGAGSGGTFFQQVPLRVSRIPSGASSLALLANGHIRKLAAGPDYLAVPDPVRERSELTAPVAYVGFGITAPELGHDDYAGIDVRGRLVALLLGAPASFPHDQRAYYSSRQVKAETAAARGALGLLLLSTPDEERRYPYARVADALQAGTMSWLDARGEPGGAVERELRGRAVLSRRGAQALFEGSPLPLTDAFERAAAGKAASIQLPVQIRFRIRSRHAALESRNVLALLRGSDPALAREYVLLTAHLDHLGIGTARDGDSIYNGAYDNASGTAVLLEIARAFAESSARPRRSIVFAALTAEEKGLLGAEYLAHHPTLPTAQPVAVLNIDMLLGLYPIRDVVAFGAEHSSLGPLVESIAKSLGLELTPDPFPEQLLFIRSDHYAFVQKGVPALMLASGLRSSDPAVDAGALLRRWIGTIYHSPRDDAAQPIGFESIARIGSLYYLVADGVANARERPAWNTGDFFGGRFAR